MTELATLIRAVSTLLLAAEQAWAVRRTLALAWRDESGETVSAQVLNDIVRARVELRELERAYGTDC